MATLSAPIRPHVPAHPAGRAVEDLRFARARFQRRAPEAERPGSIGLGLYIAREIARSHGGRIDVASSDAAGTTFTIRLPPHRRDAATAVVRGNPYALEND